MKTTKRGYPSFVLECAGIGGKKNIGTEWPIGLKLLEIDSWSMRNSQNLSIELRDFIGITGF